MEVARIATLEPTVSAGSSFDLKEQIKQATDIVELVGHHIQLRRQGRNYVGLCPWHDDSRPSLQVNPERQSWKCWVCDIGGDVFSFLMQIEGVAFPEALAMLAERANIALRPAKRSNDPQAAGGEAPDKRSLYRAMAWVEQQYHQCLCELPEGEPGRRYLQERGITAESVEKFHLGFSPDQWDWILCRAEAARANVSLLETVGVLTRSAGGGRPYDRFRGRVLFSIRDTQGRPVGVGGRVLPGPDAAPAKYVNSPETPLFHKSGMLYGLDLARDAIHKSRASNKPRRALVMEGYTDCIMAHQFGFANAVAVLGTALGEGHVRILKRFADQILLVLDGDEAGQRRANEVLDLFVAQQIDLRIVTLPTEKDPCDFLLRHGAEAFAELLESRAVDALEHAFQTATRGLDLERDVHGASQALERLIAIVAKAPRQRDDTTRDARLREEKILQRLAARFRIDEQDIRRRVTELRRKSRPSAAGHPAAQAADAAPREAAGLEAWERELLEILLQRPDLLPAARAVIGPQLAASPTAQRIYEACGRLADASGAADFARLMLEFDDAAIKSLLVELDEHGRAKGSRVTDPAALLKEVLGVYSERLTKKQRAAQTIAAREGQLDDRQQDALLRAIVAQQRARQGISEPTDG